MPTFDLPATDHLTLESKRQLLALLARELLATSPKEVTVADEAGEVFFYQAPMSPRQIAVAYARSRTIEERAELQRRAMDTENTFSFEEARNLLYDSDSEPNR